MTVETELEQLRSLTSRLADFLEDAAGLYGLAGAPNSVAPALRLVAEARRVLGDD